MQDDFEDVETAIDKLAKVYKNQASDDLFDNGLLSEINSAIMHCETAAKTIKERIPPPPPPE